MSQLLNAFPEGKNASSSKKHAPKMTLTLADRRKANATRSITFPRNTQSAGSKAFAQTLKVVDCMHEAVLNDAPVTKRDMYYRDVPLFGKQQVVDRLVDDLAATFGLGRADMHVRASSKGLFCGSALKVHLADGDIVSGSRSESTLIPLAEQIVHLEVSEDLAWVLVVEKEAIFQSLVHCGLSNHEPLPGPGIIITGKGYPDIATRHLVSTFSNNLPASIPVLALVDADPYGIDILSVYTLGSQAMAHEGDGLKAPKLQWIGVKCTELSSLGVDRDQMIPITKHDVKKALSILSKPGIPVAWRKELQYILHLRRKAEIEILSSSASFPDQHERNAIEFIQDTITRKQRSNGLVDFLVKKISKATMDPEKQGVYIDDDTDMDLDLYV
ncbi:Spo11/DNA topoisomerase VI subunit A [Abortiporus biennis]|nr:Spo11/DNA topoisomerase VI subunit A [Abortiporus biennis]